MTTPLYRMPRASYGRARVVVLIPAHNEAAAIGATIASLRRQTSPPDRIIVVADNCSDDTEDLSLLHGAEVLTTVRNTARKAGALNQALRQVLPSLGPADFVLAMDADSQLNANWIRRATGALTRDRRLGGVCGTYNGEPGPGMLLQLQRNEFVRAARMVGRRADLWVLSGTGTMFRVPMLREVARERGRTLPGAPGEYYNSSSITEDYEITLALKTLGYRCICPPGCTALTELMPTWGHLFRQRLRWQSGTLTALRRYGFTRVTWANWVRQAFFYARYCSTMACLAIIAWSLATRGGLTMPLWVLAMILVVYLERIATVWKAGPWGVFLAALLFPEWWYGMFDGLYLFQALRREFTQHDVSWGHVVRELGEHAPRHRRRLPQGGWPIPVPPAGDSGLRCVGDRPPDPGQAQAGARVPPVAIRAGRATPQRSSSGPPWPPAAPVCAGAIRRCPGISRWRGPGAGADAGGQLRPAGPARAARFRACSSP